MSTVAMSFINQKTDLNHIDATKALDTNIFTRFRAYIRQQKSQW